MQTLEFHSEWFTVENSRVFLKCRNGFPDDQMKFIANVAIKALRNRSSSARLVHIFYDDKAFVHCLYFVSDEPEDKNIATEVANIINDIFNYGNDIGEMLIVERGNKDSSHYNHMAYLSGQFFTHH